MVLKDIQQIPSVQTQQHPFELICIAASWGGVEALKIVLGGLPVGFSTPIAIAMHMSHKWSYLVEILKKHTGHCLQWAHDGLTLVPGSITIGPGDKHILVEETGRYRLSSAPKLHYVRPAADLLFESAAHVYGERVIGVVLTGLGRDGAVGCRAIKNAGGRILVQDRDTCSKFEMPHAAIETGAVDFVLPLDQLPVALQAFTVKGLADYFRVSPEFSFSHVRKARGTHYPTLAP